MSFLANMRKSRTEARACFHLSSNEVGFFSLGDAHDDRDEMRSAVWQQDLNTHTFSTWGYRVYIWT